MAVNELQPTRKPPIFQIGAILWLRTNLISSWTNGLLTFASLYLLYIAIPPLLDWMVLSANFNFGTVNILGFDIKFSEVMADNQKLWSRSRLLAIYLRKILHVYIRFLSA